MLQFQYIFFAQLDVGQFSSKRKFDLKTLKTCMKMYEEVQKKLKNIAKKEKGAQRCAKMRKDAQKRTKMKNHLKPFIKIYNDAKQSTTIRKRQ